MIWFANFPDGTHRPAGSWSDARRMAGPGGTVTCDAPAPAPRKQEPASAGPAKSVSPHEILVRGIVKEHGASRRGMATELRSRLDPDMVDAEDYFKDWRIIPDAYRLDVDEQLLTIWEVEISSRLSPTKLEDYVDLMWLLDSAYWSMRLISVDQYGVPCEIDLLSWSTGEQASPAIVDMVDFRQPEPIEGLKRVIPIVRPASNGAP